MNVSDALANHAEDRPDAPALVTPDATVSYRELDRAVAWAAKGLADAGIAPGDVVGIDAERQIQHAISVLALARLGACQFSFQPTDSADQRQALAARIGMTARLAASGDDLPGVREVPPPAVETAGDLKAASATAFAGRQDPDGPCMIVRTSGTTGVPKLAAVTFAQSWARSEPTPADGPDCRHLTGSHVSFLGARENMFRCFAAGGAFVLVDARSNIEMIEFLRRFRVSYFSGTPHQAGMILAQAPDPGCLFPDIAYFRIGTAPAPDRLRDDIRARITPNLAISYGTTETGILAFLTPDWPEAHLGGSVGRPLAGVEIEITDEDGRPLDRGETGHLRVRSPTIVSGYLDDPESTAAAFRAGWFITGDRAEVTFGGTLVIHGRDDDMMIYDGINIYPSEIEKALLDHPAVVEAAAFPRPSLDRGDIPWAAVVLNGQTSRNELIAYVKSRTGAAKLAGLFAVPRLPRNAAGKIDVARLRELAERQDKERARR